MLRKVSQVGTVVVTCFFLVFGLELNKVNGGGFCSGPSSCLELSSSQCNTREGCYWRTDHCTFNQSGGFIKGCGESMNKESCARQGECSWIEVPPQGGSGSSSGGTPESSDWPNAKSAPARDDVVAYIYPGDGHWGTWYGSYCPAGTYAQAYSLRSEPPQGHKKDDTALNAIKIFCSSREGLSQKELVPHPGLWGDWNSAESCDPNPKRFMIDAAMLIEPKLGSKTDDTAANAAKFRCEGGNEIEAPHATSWGNWGAWRSCPANSAICGAGVRIEGKQGSDADDTALNGMRFACCKLP